VVHEGDSRGTWKVLVLQSLREKSSLGKPRRRRKNTMKTDFKEWDGSVDWIYLAHDNTDGGLL
jgi:hypothetical protein